VDCVLGPLLCPFMEHLQLLVRFLSLAVLFGVGSIILYIAYTFVSKINDYDDDLWFCQSTVHMMLLITVNRYLVCSNQTPADSSQLHSLSHISECHCTPLIPRMTGMSRSTHLAADFITSITQ